VTVVSVAQEPGVYFDWVNGVKAYYVGLRNFYWPWPHPDTKYRVYRVLKPLWHAIDSYHPWMVREVARILDIEPPDLVHTNNLTGFSALTWQAIKQRDLPLVHTLRDYYLLCPRTTMFREGENCETLCTKCRLYALPRKRLSNQVDGLVGISQFVLERHLQFGYFAATPKKRVISNSYELGPYALPLPSLGTRSLPIRFGYLGRLDPAKGIEVLLEAITQLPEGTWGLEVAGQGSTRYDCYLHAKYRNPSIEFKGFTRSESFFTNIDVLVVPSLWHEPFGRVIIEAYAHGIPVIGASRGGIPELVEEGRTGFLFDPRQVRDLTAKMQRLIDQPEIINDMQPRCLKKARSFTPENITEEYLEAYAAVSTSLRTT
jgi:glycosyltransferase involved in cell wall biosynthesis